MKIVSMVKINQLNSGTIKGYGKHHIFSLYSQNIFKISCETTKKQVEPNFAWTNHKSTFYLLVQELCIHKRLGKT